ncbi:MAG: mucoidy inhibitor MuiA family protein [Myxococcota bacterium]
MPASLLAALVLAAAVDAPITEVTVFTDQARVVRTAKVNVAGNTSVELPALRDPIDPSSIQVEAQGVEVRRVDVERITPEKLRTAEAKALLADLDKLDQDLARAQLEQSALATQRDDLQQVSPTLPPADPLKPTPKLNPAGWAAGAQFASDQLAKVQARLRAGEEQLKKLREKRETLLEKAQKLGNPETTSGWKVVAQLAGNGTATLTMTYLVRNAQWTPAWDLQLQPDTNTVNLSLAGVVSQSTGEDWTQASLVLSTAIPSAAVEVPKLFTWKIGVADRFIPTPTPRYDVLQPAPPLPQLQRARTEEDLVRSRLAQVGVSTPESIVVQKAKVRSMDFEDVTVEGDVVRPDADERPMPRPQPRREYPPPPPPPAAPGAMAGAPAPMAPPAEVEEERAYEATAQSTSSRGRYAESPPQPVSTFSLAPPPAWQRPTYGADSPVTLAGGYDLAFPSLQKETIPTAKGARRVALWSAQWPVTVERKLFPALTKDAFLVAELKNPSKQVLPGGGAQLYVGADPAGTARLKLVSPGESFTLPLGIDRALRPVRNVQLVETVQGVFSKEEVGTYTVTIELANPYPSPIAVRVYDQWPLSDQKEVVTKLLETTPTATQIQNTGGLEWRVNLKPQEKTTFAFKYELRRPKDWKLQQQEVRP